MTDIDRELLELAVKAAGIEHGVDRFECGLSLTENGRHRSLPQWNPLTDDGDALRLAVKLRLSVTAFADAIGVGIPVLGYIEDKWEKDEYAATRRAIVRAAAEIGRSMQ